MEASFIKIADPTKLNISGVPNLTFIHGNLLDTKQSILAHGLSDKGVYGAGVAAQIARIFPEARTAYMNKFNKEGFQLGEIQLVPLWKPISNVKIIANLITQASYGRTGVHANLEAIKRACSQLFRYASMHGEGVSLPRIGAGLGGLEWKDVEEVISETASKYLVDVHIYYL